MEILNGGYAVEYVCRVVDQTDGRESVPETPTMAQLNLDGKTSGLSGGKKTAETASNSKTASYFNSALTVAMPVLNGFTDGVAGQVIGKGRQILSLGKALAAGSIGGIIGAGATLAAWGVSEIVKAFKNAKAKNDALAESIDYTNFQRQLAGLESINYTRSGLTGKLIVEDYR